MPRVARTLNDGEIYHLTARGTDRQDIFRSDADRARFVARLAQIGAPGELSWLSYCLMGNHVHLLVSGVAAAVSDGMRDLLGGHARWFNRRYDRTGHLFGERYHHVHVTSDSQFAAVLRYVALNPVRAGLVERPEDWPWSSYGVMARGKRQQGPVDLAGLAQRLPVRDSSPAGIRRSVTQIVEAGIADARMVALIAA